MVDTINPNTNQPDVLGGGQPPVQPSAPEERFYGGFDKPDETRINLADTAAPQPEVSPVMQSAQPVQDVSPVQPEEVKHTSYVNTADTINWRGILVICTVGLLATLLLCAGIYFGVSAANNTKLKNQQATLDAIQVEITALEVTPTPLELPATETTTPESVPVVETPVVTPTPVETPETPIIKDQGNA